MCFILADSGSGASWKMTGGSWRVKARLQAQEGAAMRRRWSPVQCGHLAVTWGIRSGVA